jgi:Ran GTPase-activating protein (RanGAP) involved in mRNA processing and transport
MILPLSEGLKTNEGLKELYLTCEFDKDSVLNLAAGLEQNKHLQALSLYSCDIFDEPSMESLIQSLGSHPTLSSLELRNNNRFGMPAVAALVRKTKQIKKLALYHPPHTINDLQVPRLNAESFSIALQENKSLKSLMLSNNGLHAGSALWLSMALRENTTLESLNLNGNLISDRGIQAIAEALPEMKGLKQLYLWNNQFSGVGARAILAGLKSNLVLEEITTFSRFRCSDEIRYYTHLNKAGRKILKDTNSVPMSLWPIILERVNKQTWEATEKASVIYTLFREGPGIVV